jgi:CGNR zinc finger protein
MAVTRWSPAIFTGMGYGRRFGWIDFVNSEYRDGFGVATDYLGDDGWRAAFLKASSLPSILRPPFPFAMFKVLRRNLRVAGEQIARGGVLSGPLVKPLNETLSAAAFRSIRRTPVGYRVGLQPAREDWAWIAAQIVASFGAFLESNQARRLKICPNPGCRWVFFDETKGNTKRWCNDRRCGNRDKVRRHRARHSAGRAATKQRNANPGKKS